MTKNNNPATLVQNRIFFGQHLSPMNRQPQLRSCGNLPKQPYFEAIGACKGADCLFLRVLQFLDSTQGNNNLNS